MLSEAKPPDSGFFPISFPDRESSTVRQDDSYRKHLILLLFPVVSLRSTLRLQMDYPSGKIQPAGFTSRCRGERKLARSHPCNAGCLPAAPTATRYNPMTKTFFRRKILYRLRLSPHNLITFFRGISREKISHLYIGEGSAQLIFAALTD